MTDRHDGMCSWPIHGGDIGRKNNIHVLLPAQREICFHTPGVFGQIFARAELRRIHEEAHDYGVAAESSGSNKGPMSIVKRAHGRDKSDGHSFSMQAAPPREQRFDRSDQFHVEDSVMGPGLQAAREE
jgi:hypothetical protein